MELWRDGLEDVVFQQLNDLVLLEQVFVGGTRCMNMCGRDEMYEHVRLIWPLPH